MVVNYTLLIGLLLVYMVINGGLVYLAYRGTKTSKDYLIAGGDNHPFIMALAYGSTFISTSAIIGFGGAAGLYGMGMLWLTVLNVFVGIFLAFVIFGKRTLKRGRQLDAHTFPEFLGKAFDSPALQKLSAGIIAVGMPLYIAAVMIGGARFLEEVLKMDYFTALLIFAVVVSAYVMTGGLKGVFYTDAFQGSIMFVGMAILLFVTYSKLGGVTAAHESLTAMNSLVPASLAEKGHQGWTSMPKLGSEYWWTLVSTLVMGVGIGVLAQPQLIVRFLTVKGPKEINRATAIGGVFIVMMTGTAFIVGSLTNVHFYQTMGKISLMASAGSSGVPNIDKIIPMFISQTMPDWFAYLFMFTLLSAAMSTLSGQFHAIGTALSHDLFSSSGIKGNRIAIMVALVITLLLSTKLPPNIIAISTAAFFGICAASFLPAYVAALYWPRATKEGAFASMVAGFAGTLVGMVFIHGKQATAIGISQALFGKATLLGFPWTFIDPMLIGLPVAAVALIGVSLVTEARAPMVNLTEVEQVG